MAGKNDNKSNNAGSSSASSTGSDAKVKGNGVKDFVDGVKGISEGAKGSKKNSSSSDMGSSDGKSKSSSTGGNAVKNAALNAASKVPIPVVQAAVKAARLANLARKMRNKKKNNNGSNDNSDSNKKLNPFNRGLRGLGFGGDKKEEDKKSDADSKEKENSGNGEESNEQKPSIVSDLASGATKTAVKFVVRKVLIWVVLIAALILFIFLIFAILIAFFMCIFGVSTDNERSGSAVNVDNGECGFTINATSLSRDEYINAIKKYSSSNSISNDFVDNAGNIYDKAKSMNLNPELVVVRAIAESGARTTSAPYNYWGMGCTNNGGGKDCHSYSSFMDGVDEFLKNISKYDSLNSMMASYSYLGDYWYNPGSGGQGGCYYASFIFDTVPSRVQTACKSGNKCSGNKCVKTTKEEQDAYTKWQVEKNMAGIREKVFGLKFGEGVACNGGNGNFSPLSSYNLKHKGLKILSKTLSSTERNNITNYVNNQVKSVYGTGAGVAMAGQSLTHALAQKGYYLGYCWGGDRSSVGFGKSWGTRSGSCNSPSNSHHYFGMDCSGFVSWSIRNGCNSKFGSSTASGFRGYGSGISIKNAKPGDLMASSGHVRLIIKNNGNSIIVAEESGSADGLIFNKYSSAGGYKIVSMSSWYKKHCKSK